MRNEINRCGSGGRFSSGDVDQCCGKDRIEELKLTTRDIREKTRTVKSLRSKNYQVIDFGDSYNDVGKLQEADQGVFYNPPASVIIDYPEIPVTWNYLALKSMIGMALD